MKKNIKTNLLEDYVNFVDSTTKQNTHYKRSIFPFVIIISLFLTFLFKYINEKHFSLQQISKEGNLDSNLKSRQQKLYLKAKFMQIKFENPKLKQSEIANQLGYSSSTLKRYRNDINMLSPYRSQAKITNKRSKRLQIQISTTIHIVNTNINDFKWAQMTSKNLKWLQMILKLKLLKVETNWKEVQIEKKNDKSSDETLHNNNI